MSKLTAAEVESRLSELTPKTLLSSVLSLLDAWDLGNPGLEDTVATAVMKLRFAVMNRTIQWWSGLAESAKDRLVANEEVRNFLDAASTTALQAAVVPVVLVGGAGTGV